MDKQYKRVDCSKGSLRRAKHILLERRTSSPAQNLGNPHQASYPQIISIDMASETPSENPLQQVPRPVKTYHSETYHRIAPTKFPGKGKTVLVTGGASSIGYAISKAFAEAGVDRVVIVSRSPGPLAKAKAELETTFKDTKIETFSASLTDTARIEEILKGVGSIDILVLSAALVHDAAAAKLLSTEDMRSSYETNVIAPFNLVKAYLDLPTPDMGSKTIINISAASVQVTLPGQVGYGSSKAALAEIMQHFAMDHPTNDGVRIFSIHPGAIYTQLAERDYSPDALPWEDVNLPAHFCTWLATGEADFLHGRFLWAHWDVDELIALKNKVAADPFLLKVGLVQ